MGSAVSAAQKPPDVELSKDEIKLLYSHLSCEYQRKVTEIVTSRASGVKVSEENVAAVPKETPNEEPVNHQQPGEESNKDGEEELDKVTSLVSKEEEAGEESDGEYMDTSFEEGDLLIEEGDGGFADRADTSLLKTTKPRVYRGKDVQRKLIELVLDDQPEILTMKVKVNPKVLQILGDDKLCEKSRMHFDNKQITPKIMARLGEASLLMPEKARKRLGSVDLTPEQRKAMQKQEEVELAQKEKERKKEIERVLESKPTDSLKKLSTDTPVNQKALDVLGGKEDESLMQEVRTHKTRDMKVTKKTIQLTGETKLLSKKVVQRRGSEMSQEKHREMIKQEMKEKEERAVAHKKELNRVLQSGPTMAQLQVPDISNAKAKKLVQLAGDAVMPEKAKKRLGDEMTPEQRRKMLEAEEQEMSRKKSSSASSDDFASSDNE